MKKCPKCKAEIQEEARFCLYCMTSFEEKQAIESPKINNKRWLYIIAAVLAAALIIICITLFVQMGKANNNSNNSSSGSSVNTSADNNNAGSGEQQENNGTSGEAPSFSSSSQTSNSSNNASANSSSRNSSTQSDTTTSSTPSDSSVDSVSSEVGSSTPSETVAVTYLYRDAVPADDYEVNSTVTNNGVVITGVKTVSESGIYEIPETINNKKVVAIMENAFCADEIKNTVRQVIIPENVKTINAYAFYSCCNLTDIYIKGEAVACPSVFLPNESNRNFQITIHASSTCHDRNFRTYKTLCTIYWDIIFEEWNG